MKKVSNRFAVYLMGVALALVLAVPTALIATVEGQGGDPRNTKPDSTAKNSSPAPKTETPRKPATKADVVKARLIELINLCKAGRYAKVASYLRRGQPDNVCPSVKANTKNGYYFGKFTTQTHPASMQLPYEEVLIWEVYYRSAADTKGEVWGFQLVNGKYVLVDIDPIRQAPQ
jgi:hypothetical protein